MIVMGSYRLWCLASYPAKFLTWSWAVRASRILCQSDVPKLMKVIKLVSQDL